MKATMASCKASCATVDVESITLLENRTSVSTLPEYIGFEVGCSA